MPQYIGYHDDAALPVKPGDTVTILKGTPVRYRGATFAAGRTSKVKVHHLLNGITDTHSDHARRVNTRNPSVRWPGSGGYWSEVDVNLIPETGATCSWCEQRPPTAIVQLYPTCETCRKTLE